MYIENTKNVTILNTEIEGNICTYERCRGGGVFITDYAAIKFIKITVKNNKGQRSGGGIFMTHSESIEINDALIENNYAL